MWHLFAAGVIDRRKNISESNVTPIPTENTSICQHCGVKVKADAQFCPYCGRTVIITPTKVFCEECRSELNTNGLCDKCNGNNIVTNWQRFINLQFMISTPSVYSATEITERISCIVKGNQTLMINKFNKGEFLWKTKTKLCRKQQ